MSFALTAKVDPEAAARQLEEQRVTLSKRLRQATESVGRRQLLDPLRAMTAKALNSRKLPTTWRSKMYPEGDSHTLTPAFFIWSKAPKIMAAFEAGATIRPLNGKRFLWIATENAPRTQGGGKPDPRKVEQRFGKFSLARGRNGTFVAYIAVKRREARVSKRGKARKQTFKRLKKGETGERIAFFILVPQVRLKKRLDIAGLAARAGSSYRIALQSAAQDNR